MAQKKWKLNIIPLYDEKIPRWIVHEINHNTKIEKNNWSFHLKKLQILRYVLLDHIVLYKLILKFTL